MNITFLVGNGFDLNQNLKTRYLDFYKHLFDNEFQNKNIEKFKSFLNENLNSENWSDVELFLGELTENIPENISDSDFFYMLLDIKEELIKYLENEEINFDLSKIDEDSFDEFINTIIYFDNFLENAQKRRKYINADKQWNINFITFNYTHVLDKIIERAMLKEYKRETSISIKFNQPIHIHGTISQNVILGVDNRKQVSQKILNIDDSLTLMSIIKPELNGKNHTDTDLLVKNKILASDVICIYGMSLGKTDQTWWKNCFRNTNEIW